MTPPKVHVPYTQSAQHTHVDTTIFAHTWLYAYSRHWEHGDALVHTHTLPSLRYATAFLGASRVSTAYDATKSRKRCSPSRMSTACEILSHRTSSPRRTAMKKSSEKQSQPSPLRYVGNMGCPNNERNAAVFGVFCKIPCEIWKRGVSKRFLG